MPALTDRQQTLLWSLIESHIHSAEAVASQDLAGIKGLDVSPATIRHELLALEEAGYLYQPHTSAGRIPTEAAWKQYLSMLQQRTEPSQPKAADVERLKKVARTHKGESSDLFIKDTAKILADLLDDAIIVAFSRERVFYTGFSHLFRQPEFAEVASVVAITQVVDKLDEIVGDLFSDLNESVDVLVGHDNPIGRDCGLLLTRLSLPEGEGLVGALGPIRQDYRTAIPVLRFASNMLQNPAHL